MWFISYDFMFFYTKAIQNPSGWRGLPATRRSCVHIPCLTVYTFSLGIVTEQNDDFARKIYKVQNVMRCISVETQLDREPQNHTPGNPVCVLFVPLNHTKKSNLIVVNHEILRCYDAFNSFFTITFESNCCEVSFWHRHILLLHFPCCQHEPL